MEFWSVIHTMKLTILRGYHHITTTAVSIITTTNTIVVIIIIPVKTILMIVYSFIDLTVYTSWGIL